jgi:hypothetical protein
MDFRWALVVAAVSILIGCGGSSNSNIPPVAAFPAPPSLGNVIDRTGRPAILTALVSTFAPQADRDAARDAYNAAPQENWASFKSDIRGNLALYDGLDGQCGNQILADISLSGPNRYDALADVLTDDRLYVNSTSNACAQYLGVELDVTNIAANQDCGGRTPTQDVVDFSYTALVRSINSAAITDGVFRDNVVQSIEVFPFLATFVPPFVPPTLGPQIDRAGRSAITTALVSTFDERNSRDDDRDIYNRTPQEGWAQFSTQIAASLAAYDGLDGSCGNQILADLTETGPARYSALANVLADDRLYLSSRQGLCSQYLGAELQVTRLAPNSDCGGRTPLYDTIDTSYTALTNDLSVVVTDGVAADNVASSTTVFPFLVP